MGLLSLELLGHPLGAQDGRRPRWFHGGAAKTLRYSHTSHPALPGPVLILSSSLVLPGSQPHLRQETERKTMESKKEMGSKMEEKTIFQLNTPQKSRLKSTPTRHDIALPALFVFFHGRRLPSAFHFVNG